MFLIFNQTRSVSELNNQLSLFGKLSYDFSISKTQSFCVSVIPLAIILRCFFSYDNISASDECNWHHQQQQQQETQQAIKVRIDWIQIAIWYNI